MNSFEKPSGHLRESENASSRVAGAQHHAMANPKKTMTSKIQARFSSPDFLADAGGVIFDDILFKTGLGN